MDPLSIGLGAVSLGSKLFSSFIGGSANKKNQNLLNQAVRDNEARYNNNAKRSYMDTNAAKGIAEQIRKQYKKANKVAENTASVTGGTDEAVIANKGKINEGMNDALGQVAQQATAYQQGQEDRYVNAKNNLLQQQTKLNSDKAANAANLASTADNLMGVAGGLTGKTNPLKGLNQFGRTDENQKLVEGIASGAKSPSSGLNMDFFKGVL